MCWASLAVFWLLLAVTSGQNVVNDTTTIVAVTSNTTSLTVTTPATTSEATTLDPDLPKYLPDRMWRFYDELGDSSGMRQEAMDKVAIMQLCHAFHKAGMTPHEVNDLNKERFHPRRHSRHFQQTTALAKFLDRCCSAGKNRCSTSTISSFVKCLYGAPNPLLCRSSHATTLTWLLLLTFVLQSWNVNVINFN